MNAETGFMYEFVMRPIFAACIEAKALHDRNELLPSEILGRWHRKKTVYALLTFSHCSFLAGICN